MVSLVYGVSQVNKILDTTNAALSFVTEHHPNAVRSISAKGRLIWRSNTGLMLAFGVLTEQNKWFITVYKL